MRELELIREIKRRAGKPAGALREGIGDDCAVLDHGKKDSLLWASDMLIEGTHFTKKDPYKKIGQKAVSVNISDVAAMGGIPKYITVSLGVPRGITLTRIRKLYDGIFETCQKYGIKVAGGDTNRSARLVIDVSIIGQIAKGRIFKRSGAKQGDLILITGPVRNGRKTHLDFVPRVKEAKFLAGSYKVSSMIDTSDGIAPDLGRICSSSGVGAKVYENALPLSAGLSVKDALYYGESFELLFTLSKKEADKLFKDRRLKEVCPYYIIGEVTARKEGVRIISGVGKKQKLRMEGFSHI